MLSQNLSETLFKPKFDYPETSMISNSGVDLPVLSRHDPLLGFTRTFTVLFLSSPGYCLVEMLWILMKQLQTSVFLKI